METVTLINGNRRPYTMEMPKIVIWGEFNDVALDHLMENTGLYFIKHHNRLEAQPTDGKQIAALFMTYNFKTRYYNNIDFKNELHLKSDHHIGYDVDSICVDCCKYNYIHTNGLKQDDRLAC